MLKTALIIVYVNKAQFRCRSFHVLNFTHSIKYMKRSTFESKMFHMSNLGQPMNYDRVAHMGISTVAYIFLPRMNDSVFNINL